MKIQKILLDLNKLNELNLDLDLTCSLLKFHLYNDPPQGQILDELIREKFVHKIGDKIVLSAPIRSYFFDSIITENQSTNTEIFDVKKNIIERIGEFREKWKNTGKPGAMGSRTACIDNMTRWFKENPDFSFDDVLKAADIYLSTEGQNLKYLQRADYFIYKKDGSTWNSRLSAYIEEIDNHAPDGWTTELL